MPRKQVPVTLYQFHVTGEDGNVGPSCLHKHRSIRSLLECVARNKMSGGRVYCISTEGVSEPMLRREILASFLTSDETETAEMEAASVG